MIRSTRLVTWSAATASVLLFAPGAAWAESRRRAMREDLLRKIGREPQKTRGWLNTAAAM